MAISTSNALRTPFLTETRADCSLATILVLLYLKELSRRDVRKFEDLAMRAERLGKQVEKENSLDLVLVREYQGVAGLNTEGKLRP